ncbi:MAG: helix-turn-helix transcriptional regulator [Lachnospiraceae bacterium]|nr:helix-turn-helix transcriptional regulator [Lachnospiraceae bacterium]
MEVDYVSLGKRVRKERKRNGMTQEELAEKVSISIKHIGSIERAESIPSVQVLVALANELKVTLDYLLYDSLSQRQKVYETQILGIIQKESEEFSKHILGYIQFLLEER